MSAKLEVRDSEIYGKGCYALVRLPARRKFALYAGEVVRGERRIERLLREQEGDIKVIRLDDDLAIDGAAGGDATAYINHSCAPNAFMRIVPGGKVAFFALRDIEPGEEITLDYVESYHPDTYRCRCGAPGCRGTINLVRRKR